MDGLFWYQTVQAVFLDQLTATVTVEHIPLGPSHVLTVSVLASNVPQSVGFWVTLPVSSMEERVVFVTADADN